MGSIWTSCTQASHWSCELIWSCETDYLYHHWAWCWGRGHNCRSLKMLMLILIHVEPLFSIFSSFIYRHGEWNSCMCFRHFYYFYYKVDPVFCSKLVFYSLRTDVTEFHFPTLTIFVLLFLCYNYNVCVL